MAAATISMILWEEWHDVRPLSKQLNTRSFAALTLSLRTDTVYLGPSKTIRSKALVVPHNNAANTVGVSVVVRDSSRNQGKPSTVFGIDMTDVNQRLRKYVPFAFYACLNS